MSRKECKHGDTDRRVTDGRCRVCIRQQRTTPEYRERRRKYKKTPSGRASTRRDQGIKDPERFEELLRRSGGSCEVCKTKDFGNKIPHLDHDHTTGLSRGILCTHGEYMRGVCALCRLRKIKRPAPGTPAPKL